MIDFLHTHTVSKKFRTSETPLCQKNLKTRQEMEMRDANSHYFSRCVLQRLARREHHSLHALVAQARLLRLNEFLRYFERVPCRVRLRVRVLHRLGVPVLPFFIDHLQLLAQRSHDRRQLLRLLVHLDLLEASVLVPARRERDRQVHNHDRRWHRCL